MSSVTLVKEASVSAPSQVFVRPSTPVVEQVQLPVGARDQWLTMSADGVDAVGVPLSAVYVRFGRTAADVAALTVAAAGAGLSALGPPIVPATEGCYEVPAGGEQHFNLFELRLQLGIGEDLHFGHITHAGGAGVLRFYISSGPNAR